MLSGVLFDVPPNGVGDFEAVIDHATIGGCVPDIWKLLRRRFADRANEGHYPLPLGSCHEARAYWYSILIDDNCLPKCLSS
jgi:hypothetical protein